MIYFYDSLLHTSVAPSLHLLSIPSVAGLPTAAVCLSALPVNLERNFE